ncbi:Mini-ribonuclease 3 [Paenibacillus thailandensis]|uniref:Mini-ribonuclease 3 n=1 Tax=Paenibacillus thailandensis TaxID=393250 RepID=A0ABW5R186_9BACL
MSERNDTMNLDNVLNEDGDRLTYEGANEPAGHGSAGTDETWPGRSEADADRQPEAGGAEAGSFEPVGGPAAGESPFPFYPPSKPAKLMNPVILAYVGDAVFELMVRQYLVAGANHKSHYLHKEATSYVSAKAQRRWLELWQPLLTEEELDVVRRGRNAKSGNPPKNADPADYRQATALECLVGYLFYEGRADRLQQLFAAGLKDGAAGN